MGLCLTHPPEPGDEAAFEAEKEQLKIARIALRKVNKIRQQQLSASAAALTNQDRNSSTSLIISRRVPINYAAAMTGLTEKAIHRMIRNGTWLEGHEYNRAPDGQVTIDIEGFEAWVVHGRRTA